jgi:hypothetical protein
MAKIIISYRHSESEYAAGSLGRELRQRFGDEHVFRDKEDIGGGVSWKQDVLMEIGRGSALLVLMGKNWAAASDAHGQRRLDNSADPVRMEIANALSAGGAVFPVLLENADMPESTELPSDICALADLNALRLRDGDWAHDLDKICAALQKNGFQSANVGSKPRAVPVDRSRWAVILLVSLVAAAGAVGYYAFAHNQTRAATQTITPAPAAVSVAQRTVALPHLEYGVWTLKGAFDSSGKHILDGSILRFTSQSDTRDGLLLEGMFTWRVDDILMGEETFKGHYDVATRGIFLEGVAVKEATHPGFPPGSLVLGSYSAILSGDERSLVHGRNGSTTASENLPLQWEGER